MYIKNIVSAIKQMTVNDLKDFICKKYYKRVGFNKENTYYSSKSKKKKIYNNLHEFINK